VGAGGRGSVWHGSLGFDLAVTSVWVPLVAGASVVVSALGGPQGLAGVLAEGGGFGLVKVVPGHVGLLAGLVQPARLAGAAGRLVVGGEALAGDVVQGWLSTAPGSVVVNEYGPTETVVGCCVFEVAAGQEVAARVPVGRPVANARVYVLDRYLNLAPAGVAGELWVGGAGVARGYLGRAALTAERFVADRFAGDGSRLYRTGDVARWTAGGVLEYLGRADDQVKVRGYRVEPGEVEATLAAHPDVRAAVVAADGAGAAARLVAYVVPEDPAAGMPPAAELQEFAAARLPGFMVPAVFAELAGVPVTAAGKVDRSALPAVEGARAGLGGGFVAPSGPVQELLAGIWARVLRLDRVGAADTFFALGGHSLLATQVVSRVREAFAVEIPLAAVFDHPTVAGLAAVIGQATPGVAAPPVGPADRGQRLPLSFAQERLWFIDQLEPGSADYNVPMRMRLAGDEVDVAALGVALGGVIARHEVLRTRLVAGDDGVAWQVIDPPGPARLPVVDVSGTANPSAAARALLAADAAAPFDLAAGPLIRAFLVRLGAAAHVLALAAHHVVTDEWSAAILRRELSALYQAARAGRDDPLPPLPVQYADFAVWQRAWLTGEVLGGQLAYWREQLAGAPVLDLPADRPRPPVRSSAGALARFTVPPVVAGGLRAAARDASATMFMTLLAAFAVLLSRYGGQDDILVGTAVANRNRAETENLIGFFVNTLVIRADLSGDPAFTTILARVRHSTLGAHAHQDLPFEQLVDALVTSRDRSRTPLVQVMFGYAAQERGAAADPGGQADETGPGGVLPVKFDMSLSLGEAADGGLAGRIQYSAALFDPATIERIAGHLGVLLEAAAADTGQPLSGLPLLTPGERDRLLAAWNDTAVAIPGVAGVHELIAARAAECTDVVAVTCGPESLTYGGMWRRAGRLAAFLRDAGAGPESVVGLCLPRGTDMVTAIVAVWRAGGAYLPLDPGYPAERLEFMLADSGASVLLGHRELAGDLVAAAGGAGPAVWLDDPDVVAELAVASPVAPLGAAVPGARLAYVIYTSGSTGTPKGVLVPQTGLVNLAAALGPVLCPRPDVRVLQFAAFGFDAAARDVAVVLAAGGTLVVARPAERAEPERLVSLVRRAGVDAASVPPSLLEALPSGGMPGVSVLFAGSERVSARVAGAWGRGRVMVNAYGPTETTVISSTGVVDPDVATAPAIGRPIANTRLYVLDRFLNLAPAGMAGELWIGGAGVTRGYLGRPGLTAERFVADRFAGDGARLYRSGDLARWTADGRLEYLGRSDEQVKVRGYRVEPGEVEAALMAHPAVRAAVVAADGDGAAARLVGYVVPADPAHGVPPVTELRDFLAGRLPGFMVPAVFTELASLPVSPNGKLDRAALPAPNRAQRDATAEFVPAATDTERMLTEVWKQVLGADRIGVTDNFFVLGGHSLLATALVSRIRTVFGVEISLAALFDHPTVREIASRIGDHTSSVDGNDEEYEEFEL